MAEDFFEDSGTPIKYELVPEGRHPAILRFVVDCGHHEDIFQGKNIIKHTLFIGWELPQTPNSSGQPHWKGDFYTVTDFVNSKTGKMDMLFANTSNFNKVLRDWTGKPAKDCAWLSCLAVLLRESIPCSLLISHVEDRKEVGKFYSTIAAVGPYRGKEHFNLSTEPTTYRFRALGNVFTVREEGYETLPLLCRNKIAKSIEATRGSYTHVPRDTPDKPTERNEVQDDDIPF